jgi:hypothetical protein
MHRCPKPGCTVSVPSSQFACKPHWFMLPQDIRSKIWRSWKSGDIDKHSAAMTKAMEWYEVNG